MPGQAESNLRDRLVTPFRASQGNTSSMQRRNTLVAQAKTNPSFGVKENITETGASTLYLPTDHMARFMIRQYLGFMADGMTSIDFYRLYDTSTPGQTGFSCDHA